MYAFLNDDFKVCHFNSITMNTFDYYYNIEESTEILNQLLLHQNNHDIKQCYEFLSNLRNVLDMNINKLNTFQLIGPANCEKTYFMNAINNFLKLVLKQ